MLVGLLVVHGPAVQVPVGLDGGHHGDLHVLDQLVKLLRHSDRYGRAGASSSPRLISQSSRDVIGEGSHSAGRAGCPRDRVNNGQGALWFGISHPLAGNALTNRPRQPIHDRRARV